MGLKRLIVFFVYLLFSICVIGVGVYISNGGVDKGETILKKKNILKEINVVENIKVKTVYYNSVYVYLMRDGVVLYKYRLKD